MHQFIKTNTFESTLSNSNHSRNSSHTKTLSVSSQKSNQYHNPFSQPNLNHAYTVPYTTQSVFDELLQ